MDRSRTKQKAKSMQGRKRSRHRVIFSYESADAKEIFLVGDFNNWNPQKHPMNDSGNGSWKKTVMLLPGRYEYKFFVDGNWREDPRNEQTCGNCFGTLNSVLDVIEDQ
jgi:1,4-alpha-glucan branching enzyme